MPANKYGKMSIDSKQNKELRKLKQDVKELQKPIERKWLDTPIEVQVSTTTTSVSLNNIAIVNQDGTVTNNNLGMNKRVGKEVQMNLLRVKGEIQILPVVTSSGINGNNTRVRMVIVRFPTATGITNFTMNSFIRSASYSTGSSGAQIIDGYLEPYPKVPYSILYDKVYSLQSAYQSFTTLSSPNSSIYNNTERDRVRVDLKFKLNHIARWGESEGVDGPNENSIGIYLFSEVTNAAKAIMNARLNFTD
nr:MAG TPA: capsid protein [Bacteriophage sp.]